MLLHRYFNILNNLMFKLLLIYQVFLNFQSYHKHYFLYRDIKQGNILFSHHGLHFPSRESSPPMMEDKPHPLWPSVPREDSQQGTWHHLLSLFLLSPKSQVWLCFPLNPESSYSEHGGEERARMPGKKPNMTKYKAFSPVWAGLCRVSCRQHFLTQ